MRMSTRAWGRHKLKGSVIRELQEKRGEEEMTASAGVFQNTQPEVVPGAAQILPTKPLGTRMHFPPHPRASVTGTFLGSPQTCNSWRDRGWGKVGLAQPRLSPSFGGCGESCCPCRSPVRAGLC